MANEFIDFVSGQSALEPDVFVKRILSIVDKVRQAAISAKNEVEKNPLDENFQGRLELAQEYLAFMELLSAGNRMTADTIDRLVSNAIDNPNNKYSAEIIGLSKLLDESDDKKNSN